MVAVTVNGFPRHPSADTGTTVYTTFTAALVVLGYSYDWMISQVGANTKGSHEFSLRYQFLAGDQSSRGRRSRFPPLGCYDNF